MSSDDRDASWLAGKLLAQPAVMARARVLYLEHGGGDAGLLALRLFLDQELRAIIGWPRGTDYAAAARHCASAGQRDYADLLGGVAQTDGLVQAAEARWQSRYASRLDTPQQEYARKFSRDGLIDADPDGPYPGIDGAFYEPGVLDENKGLPPVPVVLVRSRGMTELIAGWETYSAMAAWVASRGTTGSGELQPPPGASPAGLGARGYKEEIVLAHLLRSPEHLTAITAHLSPDAFTTDMRYDIYAAMTTLKGRNERAGCEWVEAELGRRLTSIPPHALTAYGGPGAPWAYQYLRRLNITSAGADQALSAAVSLEEEDHAAGQLRGPSADGPGPRNGHEAGRMPRPGLRLILRPEPPTEPNGPAPSPGL